LTHFNVSLGEKTQMVMSGDDIKMVVEWVQLIIIEKKMSFIIHEGGHCEDFLILR
jgi:translation elongation factor EF-Tu-like GTPase